MAKLLKHYINGRWVTSQSKSMTEVINPANGQIIALAPNGKKEEAEAAIDAAYQSYEAGVWSELSNNERSEVLHEIANKLFEHQEELARIEVENNGKVYREAESDVAESIATFRYYASLLQNDDAVTYQADTNLETMIIKEPIGVAGLIVPWNFPLLMAAWKIAPAIATGNSLILKPAEITPMTAIRFFELLDETSLPKGVANLVLGTGLEVGQTLSESEKVDLISFTGSTQVGKTIMKTAADTMKKVSLELGGKSPNLIFADANLDLAVDYALMGIYMGSGQVCSSGSRILVEEDIYDAFVEQFVSRAKQIRVGPGHKEDSEMGAIVSEAHFENILNYIAIGKQEGATLLAGGKPIKKQGMENGFFIEPTVFVNVTSDMRIVQEEIFGPVVTIQSFKDEKEAIELANDTIYGLAGAVFSEDYKKALRVIKKVRAGITSINNYHLTNIKAPWGGYKQSGIGRSLGPYGLDEYQETKQINILLDDMKADWFKEK